MPELEPNSEHLAVTARYYNDFAPNYDSTYSDPASTAENQLVAGFLKQHMGESVLDVGCGTGLLLDLVDVKTYAGFDLSAGMVKVAHNKHPNQPLYVADMHRIPLASESVDTVASLFGTFSYSTSPTELVDEFLRVLKPNGKLLIMPSSLRSKYRYKMGLSHEATVVEQTVPKTHYTNELLQEVFAKVAPVQIYGINFFGNTIEELSQVMGRENMNTNFYNQLLVYETQLNAILPSEYARHIVVIAQKPV